jgi:hypothetical protein
MGSHIFHPQSICSSAPLRWGLSLRDGFLRWKESGSSRSEPSKRSAAGHQLNKRLLRLTAIEWGMPKKRFATVAPVEQASAIWKGT